MVLAIFSAAIFTSAMLLFGIQPLYAKLVLPKLGGSPAVWSVALVFFQAVLLLGYAYAHLLITKLKPFHAALVHLCVLATALAWLPISYPADWADVPQSGLTFWVLSLFAAGVGFPFFAVSANAPMLQAWFSRTGHPQARDPYFLYGASNVGSLLGLVSYPFVLEPLLSVTRQSLVWAGGYLLLCLLIFCCWALVLRSPPKTPYQPETVDSRLEAGQPSLRARFAWMGLAMVPSGLLVGVSTFITTDLAAAPFLWVIPLALFLVTFIITFARKPLISYARILKLHAWLVAPVLPVMFFGWSGLYWMPVHLAVFFVSSMVCHGELIKRRPEAENLTEFYLWMSLGGVLGGCFSSLVAPHLFDTVLEYPILLSAVFLCRSDFWQAVQNGKLRQGWSFVVLGLLLAAGFFEQTQVALNLLLSNYPAAFSVSLIFLAVYLMFGLVYSVKYPVSQAGLVGMALVLVFTFRFDNFSQHIVETDRSFFGVSSVTADQDGKFHLLKHGTTLHGAEQRRDDLGELVEGRPIPLTYYHDASALVEAVDEVRNASGGLLRDVALVGLGAGSMACHRHQGENWRYFEIDPEVIRIARNPSNFRFLSECGESGGIVVGDGRIMLEKEADRKFDLIFLDAFSSDSIPVHLMTSEALEMYSAKLKPGGVLVFHISNRYMELGSVISSMAAELGGVSYISSLGKDLWVTNRDEYKLPALVAVVSKDPDSLGAIPHSDRWYEPEQKANSQPWTDDFSDVLSAIYRKHTAGLMAIEGRN
jgi:hypothetical protein